MAATAAVVRAHPARVAAGAAIDVTGAAVGVVLCALAFTWAAPLGMLALLTLGALLLAGLHAVIESGHGPGWAILGIRLVATSDGSPPGWMRLLPPRPAWFADTRRGRDPIALAIAPPTLLPRRTSVDLPGTGVEHPLVSARAPGWEELEQAVPPPVRSRTAGFVVVDGQLKHPLGPALVIGRSPSAGEGQVAVAVTDLPRSMSKTHLLVEKLPDGRLYVTDLGSTNGTLLDTGRGPLTPVPAHTRTLIEPSTIVRIEEHALSFDIPLPGASSTATGRGC